MHFSNPLKFNGRPSQLPDFVVGGAGVVLHMVRLALTFKVCFVWGFTWFCLRFVQVFFFWWFSRDSRVFPKVFLCLIRFSGVLESFIGGL